MIDIKGEGDRRACRKAVQHVEVCPMTLAYVLANDRYQARDATLWQGQRGAKPVCSDSAVSTFLLDGFPALSRGKPVPGICARPLCDRRARGSASAGEQLCGGTGLETVTTIRCLQDTRSIPVIGYPRNKCRRHCAGSASYPLGNSFTDCLHTASPSLTEMEKTYSRGYIIKQLNPIKNR